MYLKPVIVQENWFEQSFWIPSIFWCAALLVFVLILLVLWWFMCCLKERHRTTADSGNGNLNSSTIHNESNKNIKDRVQMSELKSKSDAEAYQDIQTVFLRPNKDKPKSNTATQTSHTSDTFSNNVVLTPLSDKEFAFNDPLRSSGRLSYCDSCSKSIDDDDMVNIFLNKMWTHENETNDVKFEVVGKSVNQAKRFRIDEVDESSISTIQEPEKLSETTPAISIPVRHGSRLKSEIFIMINDDSTVQTVDGSDDVFN